jgi:hypothetical protein
LVISFWDWSEERARAYKKPWSWIEKKVKSERQRRDESGNYVLRKPLPDRWWQYGDKRPGLYHAIGRGHLFEQHPDGWRPNMKRPERVLIAGRVGKYFNPSVVDNDSIFHEKCVVFAVDHVFAHAAVFNSSPVDAWVWKHSSRLKLDLNFSPSDAVEPFPFLSLDQLVAFEKLGYDYLEARRKIMTDAASPIGFTDLYNRFHNADHLDSRIVRLREMHSEIDVAVMCAYGWDDLKLGHGYHEQLNLAENDRVRFTISDAARVEVLRRFAELNRQRYEQEQAGTSASTSRAFKRRGKEEPASQAVLIEEFEAEPKTSNTHAAVPAKKSSTRRTDR